MKRTQAKAQLKKLIKKAYDLQEALRDLASEAEDLKSEVEETRDEIEPYENRDELTEQQEERYEYFDELADAIDTFINDYLNVDIEDGLYDLEDKAY